MRSDGGSDRPDSMARRRSRAGAPIAAAPPLTAASPQVTRIELATLATRANLPAMIERATLAAEQAGLAPDAAGALRLAVEEACVNVIDHAYPPDPPGPIRLSIAIDAERIVVEVVDGAAPFDPSDAPAPDLTTHWRQRRIGGLGWHLIRHVMDEVVHEHPPGGGNRLTLVKHLQSVG